MNTLSFTFSDMLTGYVDSFDQGDDSYVVKTSDGRPYHVRLRGHTYGMIIRNLDDPHIDCTAELRNMLAAGQYVYTYGIFYPEGGKHVFEAQFVVFVGQKPGDYLFERPDWWIRQIKSLGDFYLKAQFGPAALDPATCQKAVNYAIYRTTIKLTGEKDADNYRQETDTISRLVYGFATAYLLTGDDRYLEGAEKGTEYLRAHLRFYDGDEKVVYWYHAMDVHGGREEKIFSSEFGDDYFAVPAYEQIYALAGPIQTYRVTGDPRILQDAEMTVDLFDRFFLDKEHGGYFSHLHPITLDPRAESLGDNRGKKNWNSVGDHAPAYLINLYLATGEERYAKMLEYTFDTIAKHFPDYHASPFVQEKFHEDWSHDRTHMWQQNRAVIGHNLKIAWNVLRMYAHSPKSEYADLARKIGELMPAVGSDTQRGGWYDVVERLKQPGQAGHRFAFHDRKAWWQQEQAILAYLIMAGVLKGDDDLRHAREASSFYNAWFLDHDDGAVYFNVLATGVPFLMGTERFKGSHSMSGYHSFELCYLAQVYTNLLITKQPLELYFKPLPGGFKDNLLRVAPDLLPSGTSRLTRVWVNDIEYTDFDPQAQTVRLPQTTERVRVKVRLEPTA